MWTTHNGFFPSRWHADRPRGELLGVAPKEDWHSPYFLGRALLADWCYCVVPFIPLLCFFASFPLGLRTWWPANRALPLNISTCAGRKYLFIHLLNNSTPILGVMFSAKVWRYYEPSTVIAMWSHVFVCARFRVCVLISSPFATLLRYLWGEH